MISITSEIIKDKAKEFNIVIKTNNIYSYSLIYIQILKGTRENRKKFIQWVEDNRPMKVKIEIKETNLIKEIVGVIINRVFIIKLVQYHIIISLIKNSYMGSLMGILFLILLIIGEYSRGY